MFVTLTILVTAVCLLPAFGKLTAQPKVVATADRFGIPWERYRLLAFPEIAAAIGVLVGLIWIGIGLAATAGMALLLLGALAIHRRAADELREAVPGFVALGVCAAYLAVAVAVAR